MRRAVATLALAVAACAPAEVIFHVDTDAPVAFEIAGPEAGRSPGLFDRLSIEVLEAAGAGWKVGARRDFAVSREAFLEGRVSFGVLGSPAAVRLRLFLASHVLSTDPAESASLTRIFRLPAAPDQGVIHVSGFLPVDEVGAPVATLEPRDVEPGILTPSRVGSWAGAQVTPCPQDPESGQVCVPGGAFWLGDPTLREAEFASPGPATAGERLVVVSPFFLDLTEVSVEDFAAEWPGLRASGQREPHQRTTSPTLLDDAAWCTWTSAVATGRATGGREPINCLDWSTADAYCRLLGKRLPREAEFEFIASGRGAEQTFPWGSTRPGCADAIFGRSGLGVDLGFDGDCRPPGGLGGPVAVGTARLDRVSLPDNGGGTREIVDLAGNISEFSADGFRAESPAERWPPGVLVDPREDDDTLDRAVRAGSWASAASSLLAARRFGQPAAYRSGSIGFRCARGAGDGGTQ